MERLLDFFIPKSYQLNLFLDKHAETISGTVKIAGKVSKAGLVKLHSKGQTIDFFKINGEINYFFLDMPADKYYPYSNKQYGNAGKNDYDDTLIVLEKIQRTAKDKNGRY